MLLDPYRLAAGVVTDPNFASVVLLLHFEGANGSTANLVDSSGKHTVSQTGTSLTTAQARFGTASLSNPSGTSFANSADSPDWDFGSGQFTVECFVRPTVTIAAARTIVSQWGSGVFSWALLFNGTTGTLLFQYSTTGADSPSVSGSYVPPLNTWTHIAVDRDASGVLRVYADGVVIASATVAAAIFNTTRSLVIANDFGGTRGLIGQLDELRITKGVARYGGAFTPPAAPFPDA